MNRARAETGQELACLRSNTGIAMIAGFVAGGSGRIGAPAEGMLRDNAILIALGAMSVKNPSRLWRLEGPEALHLHRAWWLRLNQRG